MLLHGEVPERIEVREGAVRYEVDPWHGQKTGLFLDQRENREAALRYARGRAARRLQLSRRLRPGAGAALRTVLAVDISEDAVARIRANAARNGLANVEARTMNVFDELRELERSGARFDTIVLDPPAFAKNKRVGRPRRWPATRRSICARSSCCEPGGFLITCSCSYNVSEQMFLEVVGDAAIDARAELSLVEKRAAGTRSPHPSQCARDAIT